MKEVMNIAIALNRKYIRYTYVMLTSLFYNNKNENIKCYMLHSELTDEDISIFNELAKQYGSEIVPIMVNRNQFATELPTDDNWTIEIYYRLMLAELMPESVKRLLYLDGDIIVLKNLREYYSQDFQGKNFVVCKEYTDGSKIFMEKNLGFPNPVPEDYVYFNSGVMLWNIENIRKNYNFSSYMNTAKELNYDLFAPDQDLLNYIHWNQVKYSDGWIYNCMSHSAKNSGLHYKDIIEKTTILHFAGPKPWNAGFFHYDIEQIWWDYAKKTPFYNEFCHELVDKTMRETSIKNRIKHVYIEVEQAKNNLKESLALNQKLMEIIKDRN